MIQRFQDKIVAVTAAASGIGRATVERLAKEGACVLALDINDAVNGVAEALRGSGGLCEATLVNCTDRISVEECFAKLLSKHGRIDGLVNVVGRHGGEKRKEFFESDPDLWDEVISASLKATMLCCRQVVPGMRARSYGRVVNIASTTWMVPVVKNADYAAAKAGVIGFTRNLSFELARHGVTVNAISPGQIETPATKLHSVELRAELTAAIPMGRYGHPEDVASAVAYLASDDAAFVTGHNLVVSGGRGLA